LIGQNLKRRIVAEPIRVVGVLVASDDLVETLAKQRQHRMMSPFLFAKISKTFSQIAGESVPLVKVAQRQQTSRTDLPARK
jgi:hypothetical protein